jgi:uncharacterized protein YjbI with pentapeptide repeats
LKLVGGDFQLADFTDAILVRTNFSQINLARADFGEAMMNESLLFDCQFLIADFGQAKMNGAIIGFFGNMTAQTLFVALQSMSGIGPTLTSTFESEGAHFDGRENPGEYLEHSQWLGTEVEGMTIIDTSLMMEETPSLDLSGMRYLTSSQYESIDTPDGCIPPQLIDRHTAE